ncbi:MAG: amidohydrolase family protein, partial [Pseudomonadota bacterium]|nr:amidohydrolase family protein [Pseudomonadota bacterium]
MKHHLAIACSLLALTACDKTSEQTAKTLPLQVSAADTIYYGGDILTMTGDEPEYAQAIATQGDKIIFVGDKTKALEHKFGKTKLIDLQGKTLMPGFVDGHSHVYAVGLQAMVANVLPSPDGDANSVEQIVNILTAAQNNPDYTTFIEKTGAILGFGYDDAELDRYPTKMDLDRVSTEKPVIIIHTSGHLSVANSKALAMAGIDENTENPDGGIIRRMTNSQEPNGVLEENAHFGLLFKLMKSVDPDLQDLMLQEGQKLYTKYGYTTAQEGRATQEAYD